MTDRDPRLDRIERLIRDVPDFPEPGVVFKDITPLLADPSGFADSIDLLADVARDREVSRVAGVEARGFMFATGVALKLGVGFVPVRKAGKLPGATSSVSYALEYGEATIEVRDDAFAPSDRVLIVDDVLATGGTVAATVELVRQAGADVAGVAVLLELGFLHGRDKLPGLDLTALLSTS